jgi:hypothetical protein
MMHAVSPITRTGCRRMASINEKGSELTVLYCCALVGFEMSFRAGSHRVYKNLYVWPM